MLEGRRRPGAGRSEGSQETREAFLDAAERNFAEKGYAGASLREIAQDAELNTAMVSYWFGSKIEMFKEVYLRRGTWLAARRMDLLKTEAARADIVVEDLLGAYLRPAFELRASVQGRAFLRLQARLHAEPDEMAYQLRREVYDGPVHAYVAALARLMPGKSEQNLAISFAQFIGIYLYILSDAHRLDQIGHFPQSAPPPRDLIEEIVRFAAAGFRA